MNKPTVYRPLRDEHNPNALHYGACSVEDAIDDFINNEWDYPMDGDSIAVRSVRVVDLPPVGNKTAIYRLTKIDGDYTLDLNKGAALRFISNKPFNDPFITYSLLKWD